MNYEKSLRFQESRQLEILAELIQQQVKAPYAFQVVFDMDPIVQDCFAYTNPMIVPVQTLLSQLV